ncbi:hypothetical protein [Halorhodospira halophila]|uniref:hypothetical protein n=1 Tax=Halorhodospira halophila TaxID=1053 RepID=UPI0019114772|nr:hypothetical protein [Halorhodospira halophila]MBK5935879.1 hypothetical protein [Halorhodospira halophila]
MSQQGEILLYESVRIPAREVFVEAPKVLPPDRVDPVRGAPRADGLHLPATPPILFDTDERRDLLNPLVVAQEAGVVHPKSRFRALAICKSDLEAPELEALLRFFCGSVQPALLTSRVSWREAIDWLRSDAHLRSVIRRKLFDLSGDGQLTAKQEQLILRHTVSRSSLEKYRSPRSGVSTAQIAQEPAQSEATMDEESADGTVPKVLSSTQVDASIWQAALARWDALGLCEQYGLPTLYEVVDALASAQDEAGEGVASKIVRTMADPQYRWDDRQKVERLAERVRQRLAEHASGMEHG